MKKQPTLFLLITFLAITLFCPTSSKADTTAHAIWGVGVQLGWAEVGAYQGASPITLVQSLTYARDMASQSGCIAPDELERLRVAMSQTRDSLTLYQRITTYRQSLPPYLQRDCRCAGGANAAWALWGLGVQIGWAEMASYLGAPASYVQQALISARDHARQITCINTRIIEELIAAMSRVGDSRMLYQRITSYRQQQLLADVSRNCSCGGQSQLRLEGIWRRVSDRLEETISRSGESYVGTISVLSESTTRVGFRIGERTMELVRTGPATF